MSYNIIWTPRALQTFNDNIDYLTTDWDENVINDFLERTDQILNIICNTPQLFAMYKSSMAIHKVVVTKQITLYYKIVNHTTVDLITFWNVYQHPKRLNLK